MKSLMPGATLCCALIAPACAEAPYNPKIDPAKFTSAITNPLMNAPAGTRFVLEGAGADGKMRDEITVTGEKRMVMGVETTVYVDNSYVNGVITEVSHDYLAQDDHGNVWNFGETVDNFTNGKLKNHQGTWAAGEKGALPGIIIKATGKFGDTFREEYAKGQGEDFSRIISTDEFVNTPSGVYKGCTKMFGWTPLEPDLHEMKYYCPGAGGLVALEDLGAPERIVLSAIIKAN